MINYKKPFIITQHTTLSRICKIKLGKDAEDITLTTNVSPSSKKLWKGLTYFFTMRRNHDTLTHVTEAKYLGLTLN